MCVCVHKMLKARETETDEIRNERKSRVRARCEVLDGQ